MSKYTIIIENKNGKINISRSNDGFNPFELLGFLDVIREEIQQQLRGDLKPLIISKAQFVEQEK